MSRRGVGISLVVIGILILAASFLAPVPRFEDLERRTGVVEDARNQRTTFCRRLTARDSCLHTVVDIRQAEGVESYNFAQTPVADIAIGRDIVLWVAPSIRGLGDMRVWHAEQDGRVVRDYESQARADRRLIWVMVPLAPVLVILGYWMIRPRRI
jgi:predicted dithiol-disulfide oxidoreductase (DUF899 family)